MSDSRPKSKRKRSFLRPGTWRGKRSRTNSESGSPPDLGASALGTIHPPSAAQPSESMQSSSLSLNVGSGSLVLHPSSSVHSDSVSGSQGGSKIPSVATPGHTSNQGQDKAAWVGLENALAALHITAKMCPPLRSAIDSLRSCLRIFADAARSCKDYEELATGLTAMVDLLIKHMSVAVSGEIMDALENIAKDITTEMESIDKRQNRSGTRRVLGAQGDDEDLVRRYRRIEQLFRRLQAEASMGTWNDTKRHLVNTQLENLGPVKLASYNSRISMDVGRRSCTENTRTQILSESMNWANNPDGAKIYWMNGMAGTGKTTITYSLCERLDAVGKLAASFFCTRASRECSEAKQIVPTIAYQLARRSAPFRDALCEILDKDPDVGSLSTTFQFESLLAKPLTRAKKFMARNLVIVIDALDECNDPHAVTVVLDILFRFAADLPVKFFVTSRPEPAIRNSMMTGIGECNRPDSILYLHEVEKSLVQADIRRFLEDELKQLLPTHSADVEELAEQAGNLFIYAATAIRYIQPSGRVVNSKQRLRTILGINRKSKNSLSDIDALYSAILSTAFQDGAQEPEEREDMQVLLWSAICASEPVLIDTLAILSGLEKDLARSFLQSFHSVLHISEHKDLVTTLHASFPDFMFARERSQEFYCDRSGHDKFLAKRCLEIMNAQLRFNICQLKSSFDLDEEIVDLEERIETHISQELFYACRFWVDHLTQGIGSSSLIEVVYHFLSRQLLFWMEVLNLKKCMVIGAVASTRVHMWLKTLHVSSSVIDLARDAQTFVGNYTTHQVSSSTPHIYISALPLSSPTSLIHLTYSLRFTGLVQVTGSLMEKIDQAPLETWKVDTEPHRRSRIKPSPSPLSSRQSPSRQPFYTHSSILSASFSADRKHLVIAKDNGEISMRNPQNGVPLINFQAYWGAISSIAFSSDGSFIFSTLANHTVYLRNIYNGILVSGPYKGHTKKINSVGFSPNGMRLVSGSDDCTIRIWVKNAPPVSQLILTEHTTPVRSVEFSPNGRQIVSGTEDCVVRVWDALKGTLLHKFQGHTEAVTCVRFSSSGAFVFSASEDCTIRVWDTHKGIPAGSPFNGHSKPVTSITISPEGERFASGSADRTIRVWHKSSGELIAVPFEGHTGSVRSVQFSADGARVISASEDNTVRTWNAQGRTRSHSAIQHFGASSQTTLTAISPDGVQIASGYAGGMIWVGSIRDGTQKVVFSSSPGYLHTLLFLAFSIDGTSIFAAYSDGLFYVMEVMTAELTGDPQPFSPHGKMVSHEPIALSPDGRIVVSSATFDLCALDLWDRQAKKSTLVLNSSYGLFSQAVFSSNSSQLLTGTTDGTLTLWDTCSGQVIAGPFLSAGKGRLLSVDISPGGTHLVSCLSDRHPWIFDVTRKTCEPMLGFKGDEKGTSKCLKLSLDGSSLAYACREAPPDEEVVDITGIHEQPEYEKEEMSQGRCFRIYLAQVLRDKITKKEIRPHALTTSNTSPYGASSVQFCGRHPMNRTKLPHGSDVLRLNFNESRLTILSVTPGRVLSARWLQAGNKNASYTMTDDGWFLDEDSNRILWVPPEIRYGVPNGNGLGFTEEGSIEVDYDNMLIGDEWSRCYIGDCH